MTKIAKKTFQGYIDASTAYANSLDRSALGRFGSSLELFIISDAEARNELDIGTGAEYDEFDFSPADEWRAAFEGVSYHDQRAAEREVRWWWYATGDADWVRMSETYTYSGVLPRYEESNIRFQTIADNPDMHDYFAADLWDVDFNARCIGESIDTTLAYSMHDG